LISAATANDVASRRSIAATTRASISGVVPVAEADRAALVAAAVAAGVAHEFVDHPGGDAGVLQPGREGVPKVVRSVQVEVVEGVIARGVGR
jgi:hypothetical protein